MRHGVLSLCLLMGLVGCQRPSAPLDHDAYVWQRVWTPAVNQAMRESAGVIHEWRVLAAQTDTQGHLQRFSPDRPALLASGRPVVLVVRIDGQLAHWDEAALLRDTLTLWHDWQASGMPLAGLEIDHDCASARLPAYADFLAQLRAALPPKTMLSITALPTWMQSASLRQVLAKVDQSVLQVHAVRDPRAGLFDAALALHWVEDYAGRSDKPFRVALPDYGSRVSWDAQGRLADVESEAVTLDFSADAHELLAQPQVIADFIRTLQRDPPPHLQGIAWFRLPTTQDLRAWSLPTWLAVIRGESLHTTLQADVRHSGVAGTFDVLLRNNGTIDAMLPLRVTLPPGCTMADGVNGYRLQRGDHAVSLQRLQPGLLRAHHQRTIGWLRCPIAKGALHVES